ncbi:heterokaryon incompatibility protein-domain-containing protein [Annulohypoxylon bovei var. microspora]|nr:heterokaryon incompatibility protein-domain-containing protein [Annulohypoxylon bovei var. microspora]
MTNLTIVENGRGWIASVKRSDRLEVGECCPRQAYVELQIPKLTGSVTRVTISTLSHDQGWSDQQDRYGGTYESTNTFFDLAVATPSCHERIWSFTFQKNIHARIEPHRHENVWDVGSSDKARCAWLQSIRGDDTIQVFPMAMLQLWTNFVYEVEIKAEGIFQDQETNLSSDNAQGSTGVDKLNIYKPLQESRRQTRVLSLCPGRFEDPLLCSITTISLDDPSHGEYEALSYCWGDVRTEETIQLRESLENPAHGLTRGIAITANLYEALKHMRPESGPPRNLWADAVCIDQANFGEWSQQVALMPSIYAGAVRVVVWLGTSADLPMRHKCFSALQAIQERFRTRYDASRTYTPEERELIETEIINAEITNMVDYTIHWNLCDFDWFKRTWVLQEISNASTAVFRCGLDEVSWPIVSSVIRLLQAEKLGSALVRARSQPTNVLRSAIVPSIWFSIVQLGETSQGLQMKTSSEGILEILVKAHSLKATDPRDKLYALLQFGNESKDVANLPLIVKVDYSKTPVKVFTDFVRWWICTHQSLRILSSIHTLKSRSWQQMYYGEPLELETLEYPSWCFWPVGDDRIANATLGLSLEASYQASGSTMPEVEFINSPDALKNPHILQLTGHRLCTISKITPFPLWEFPDQPHELRDAFMRVFDPASYGRFVLHDVDDQDTKKLAEGVREFLARHYTYHARGFKERTPYVPCLSPCFFVADELGEGCYGLCPHNARPGDMVVMLYGGPVLYLLRESKLDPSGGKKDRERATDEKKHQFVGECFLQGYMNGKALTQIQEKGLEKEVFNLV